MEEAVKKITSPQLSRALQSSQAQKEADLFDGKTLQEYLARHQHDHLCVFCKHRSILKAGDTSIMLCFHCFKIIEANIEGLKQFIDCK